MVSRYLVWTYSNVAHIARHGIRPQDAESLLARPVVVQRGRKGYHCYYGKDGGGRYLVVVLDPLKSGRWYVVTARLMTDAERRLYERKGKGRR